MAWSRLWICCCNCCICCCCAEMASFMSWSVFETGVELLWRPVFGFGLADGVCATTLVVIRTASAKASGRFIFSFSPENSVGQDELQPISRTLDRRCQLQFVDLGSPES